jgi:hypothetical protein
LARSVCANGPFAFGGDPGRHAARRRFAEQIEDFLIGFQPVGHGDGGGLVAGEVAHLGFEFADALFLRGAACQPGPEADLFPAAEAVPDGGADGVEKLADLRGGLGDDERREPENEHTKDEALGRAPDAFLS